MKFEFPCSECYFETNEEVRTEKEISNDGVYEVNCTNGHKSIQLITNEKYEILYDLGLLAINNGFAREAVSSFAVSLERFYEFCVRVMLNSKGINDESVNGTWKLVSSQSERQLGAFYFLYLTEFNEAPDTLPSKQVTFRNNVIHKGYIPSENEVVEYAKAIFDHVIKVTILLKRKFESSLDDVYMKRKQEVQKKYVQDVQTSFFGTTLSAERSISYMSQQEFNFEYERAFIHQALYTK